jgi:excinuclease ABC subunit C
MVKRRGDRRAKDPSAGGKRSAMAREDAAEWIAPAAPCGAEPPSLGRGLAVLAEAVKTLPGTPGVYRMLNRRGEALYVGKAQNLKKRVTSYTQLANLPRRLQRMVAETARLEVVNTHTEIEALLLESNLIKRLMPRYNVLLRDDKSFPYILITGDHAYPQIAKHRGAHSRDGVYFGPFASAGAVNRTITALEKAFLLRSCSDAVFAGRARPCLMYQIKRCAAPCVGRISEAGYGELVAQAKSFLTGRSQEVQQRLSATMQEASDRLDFESAAVYRDRIRALAHIQSHQDINVEGLDDADVIAAHQEAGQTCVQVFFFRAGRNYGNRAYFPSHDKNLDAAQVLSAFVSQFYDGKPTPPLVMISHGLEEQLLIAEALSARAGRKVTLLQPKRGAKRKLVESASANAREALARRLAESSTQRRLLEGLSERLELEAPPERIEVYDNSHIQGDDAYGVMIVAGPAGFVKQAYRRFRIKGARADATAAGTATATGFARGDDYAMMREVFTRRFSRALKEDPGRDSGQWPDLVLIDGGRGQLNAAREVLADLGVEDLALAAIAKGPERNAGRERIFLAERPSLLLPPRDPVLYFLQRLRDEAHRFAIGTHRRGRTKSRLRSALDEISGIGAKRKKALLHHFGSAQAVARAGLADLEAVEGISAAVARRIYDHFRQSA